MASTEPDTRPLQIAIHGRHLPGRMFRYAGVPIHGVHVGLQVRNEPEDLVPGDAPAAEWQVSVRLVHGDGDGDGVGVGALDFRGPAVHGSRGHRFLYLTWGDVTPDGGFTMFRRAKLMLDAIAPTLVAAAARDGRTLHAHIDLTDDFGGPRCARVDPPALVWSLD
jgi:hypothetical protein